MLEGRGEGTKQVYRTTGQVVSRFGEKMEMSKGEKGGQS